MVKRSAFTMIELIYAIVIMAIVFVSLPMILFNNARNIEQNILQEAILVNATSIGLILSFPWDDASTNPLTTTLSKTEVVDVTASPAVAALGRVSSTTDFRIGHIQESKHRRMVPHLNSGTRIVTTPAGLLLGNDGSIYTDIDDFVKTNFNAISITPTQIGYKNDYWLDIRVSYVNDLPANAASDYDNQLINFAFSTVPYTAAATNLKMVDIMLKTDKDSDGAYEEQIRLRSYSANIGESDYHMRTY